MYRIWIKLEHRKNKDSLMVLQGEPVTIKIEGKELEQVDEFVYLGSCITDNAKCEKEIRNR